MRLINVHTLELKTFHRDVPKYVTASHRWEEEEEASMDDVINKTNTDKRGFKKMEGFAKYIREDLRELQIDWLWIDTCCVDQKNPAEVSEAVNSMFRWYADAALCIAYLTDVGDDTVSCTLGKRNADRERKTDNSDTFEGSVWFKRGWTLQELVAPSLVVFLTRTWQLIGHKGSVQDDMNLGPALEPRISSITNIPEDVLLEYDRSKRLTPEQKLAWSVGRETKKEEDMYYSLLGIFNVRMWLDYGEGAQSARKRLLGKIAKLDKPDERIAKIEKWLSAPDPWSNLHSARDKHEAGTGDWILRLARYQRWKTGSSPRLLWLYGKAGSGKTILFSRLAEDVRAQCEILPSTGFAMFYFSFSDSAKQDYTGFLRSIVTQLGQEEPALDRVFSAQQMGSRSLGLHDLKNLCQACIDSYDQVYLLIDALDECPCGQERSKVLAHLQQLVEDSPKVRILITSREEVDIRDCFATLGVDKISLTGGDVDKDIRRYIKSEIGRSYRLKDLSPSLRQLIEDQLTQKSDGMFRWVYCQMLELQSVKSSKPSRIRSVLDRLPATLDETYERILLSIPNEDRKDALVLLRWLAYARFPPTLGELVDACIIDITGDGSVNFDERGEPEDTLRILSGLVTLVHERWSCGHDESRSTADNTETGSFSSSKASRNCMARLAHFSVKEYLESPRILTGKAHDFHLSPANDHGFLTKSCLTYLMHCSSSEEEWLKRKSLQTGTFVRYPLLLYAAQYWHWHSALKASDEVKPEITLLQSDAAKRVWLLACDGLLDDAGNMIFAEDEGGSSALYSASRVGLVKVVTRLLDDTDIRVNDTGGLYGTALQAASAGGHLSVVQLLLRSRARLNTSVRDSEHGTALTAAASAGYESVVRSLLGSGAKANTLKLFNDNEIERDRTYSALNAASSYGHTAIVQMLLEHGADVNGAEWGVHYGGPTALYVAASGGHKEVFQLLLRWGANITAHGDFNTKESTPLHHIKYGTLLQAACLGGNKDIVQLLLDCGVDVNTVVESFKYRTALNAAREGKTPFSDEGRYDEVIQLLLDHGAKE